MLWLGCVLDHWVFSAGTKFFCVPWDIQTASRAHQTYLFTVHLWGHSRRVQWLRCKAHHSYFSDDVMKMLPCLVSFCVHSCNFSFNPSFSCPDSEIVDFWCTCPAWIPFIGVLVKRLVFLCRYCYLCVTYWAFWRLVNGLHSLHEMGRICFKVLDCYIVRLLYESYLEFIFRP
jgi:hypothetical protein